MKMVGALHLAFTVLFTVTRVTTSEKLGGNNVSIRELLEGDIIELDNGKSGIRDKIFRWPNATIPFEFAENYPMNLRSRFLSATEYISMRTCIRFVPRTNQVDHIKVMSGSGCSSAVGRRGMEQNVSLPEPCTEIPGIIVHELIHTIGFYHEQSRSDRDQFVKIHYENVQPGKEHNFERYEEDHVSTFGVDYDFGSIMHYGNNFFSKNGNATITTIPPGIPIGQVDQMSPGDILKINRMYEC